MVETRELFWNIGGPGVLLFYGFAIPAMALFAWGFVRHVVKYRRGGPARIPVRLSDGVRHMLSDVFSQRTIARRDSFAGHTHSIIFYGFVLLFIGTSTITLDYDIIEPLTGVSFWQGWFYKGFSLVMDVAGVGLIVGVVLMMIRRGAFRLPKLVYVRSYRGESEARPSARAWINEDWLFLWVLLIIAITGFLLEGVRIVMDRPPFEVWSVVGWQLANLFELFGMTKAVAADIRAASWWFHGLLALAFIGAIPWNKAKHIISVMGSLASRDRLAGKRLARIPEETEEVGIRALSGFSWKDMLNFDACTKCGRCHDACPARTVGYPLSPRDLILDLRLANDRAQGRDLEAVDLVGDIIDEETLWACRTCNACVEICPVGIEHMPIIVEMRRALVDQDRMDPLLRTTLATISNTGNSFGENSRRRGGWTQALDFPVKDIRQEAAEHLWFVGDYASFDPRNQQVSQTVAKLLRLADVDYGILYDSERTAGNDVRRVGEEGLFESLVEHNTGQMADASFGSIITTDPHSYNTIRNEYPDFAPVKEIRHYSQVLAQLLRDGRLKVTKPLGLRVTLHDPCHLGRFNGQTAPPRDVLAMIGCELVEMPRHGDNSFCCGAGGGRIWIPDKPGVEKPSENRMHEAAALNVDTFVVCCPKDLTMFEDARKTSGHEGDLVVADLAELVAQAIQLDKLNVKDAPRLVDQIVEAAAEQIAERAVERFAAKLEERMPSIAAGAAAATAATMAGHMAGVAPAAVSTPPAAAMAPPATAKPPAAAAAVAADPVETTDPAVAASAESPVATETPAAQTAEQTAVPAESTPSASTGATSAATALTPIDDIPWKAEPLTAIDLPSYEVPAKDGPRIMVAVKHVAQLGDEFAFREDSRDVQSDYFDFVLNEWDDAALEHALRLVEAAGSGEVVAVTIGADGAEESLRRILAKGAHRGVRVWADGLDTADPVTIARILAGVVQHEQPDLILTGAQSGEHAHGATGTALARILGLPHLAIAVEIEWSGSGPAKVTRELEGGLRHTVTMPTPALVSIQTGITPRYATLRMIKQARQKPLEVVDGSAAVGATGGFEVRRMYTPPKGKGAEMISGSAEDVAAKLAEVIRNFKGA